MATKKHDSSVSGRRGGKLGAGNTKFSGFSYQQKKEFQKSISDHSEPIQQSAVDLAGKIQQSTLQISSENAAYQLRSGDDLLKLQLSDFYKGLPRNLQQTLNGRAASKGLRNFTFLIGKNLLIAKDLALALDPQFEKLLSLPTTLTHEGTGLKQKIASENVFDAEDSAAAEHAAPGAKLDQLNSSVDSQKNHSGIQASEIEGKLAPTSDFATENALNTGKAYKSVDFDSKILQAQLQGLTLVLLRKVVPLALEKLSYQENPPWVVN